MASIREKAADSERAAKARRAALKSNASGECKWDVNRILLGRLDRLPTVSSKTVRIFLSSTFSDFILERNALMEHVYPKLKDFCRQYGLEFQVVDMRWGVREEAQDDHMTSSLCMKEIHECQRISVGPTFVVLFGQKYGYRPFPASIASVEFENLHKSLVEDGKDVSLLTKWFQRDDNLIPPEYCLVPISSQLVNYVNRDDLDLQQQDRNEWNQIFEELQQLLRRGADLCLDNGTLSKSERQKYYISVTEDEVEHGIRFDNIRGRQVCLQRVIEDLRENIHMSRSEKFIDKIGDEINDEAQQLLKEMQENTTNGYMDDIHVAKLSTHWGDCGLNESEHKTYIHQLCKTFYAMLSQQILDSVEQVDKLENEGLVAEVLQHLSMCQRRCTGFKGRHDLLDRIKQYLLSPQEHPLVIHGESGSGKTSIMALLTKSVLSWLPRDVQPVIIVRFLGTTPKSSNLFVVLQNVCQHLAKVYGIPFEDTDDDLNALVSRFFDLLKLAHPKKPLILVLDSLDQLSSSNYPSRLSWLPSKLPPSVHIVLSTLPNEQKILYKLKNFIPSTENFIEVPPLGSELGCDIIKGWLADINKTLSDQQFQIVKKALDTCSLPLYAKLVFEEVCRWKSFQPPEHNRLEDNVKGLINMMFDRIEIQHGKRLVTMALAYMTASRAGLTEAELEDVLSLDDEVLDEIFTFWVPPIRRIPPLLWTRIRNDLSSYLVEREADGATVLAWYHRQFWAAMRDRYLSDRSLRIHVHSTLADYFIGKWGGGKKKPFRYSAVLSQRMSLTTRDSEADRKIPKQPLRWKTQSRRGVEVRYNLRKLTELPYHLYKSERYSELWKEVFYNYKWLHTKLKACSVIDILSDTMLVNKHHHKPKIDILISALRVAGNSLKQIPNTLAVEILGRFKPHIGSYDMIDNLISQCKSDGLRHCSLLPAFQCFDAPSQSLIFSLEGHQKQVTSFVFNADSTCLYSTSLDKTVVNWDLMTGDQFFNVNAALSLPSKQSELILDKNGHLVLESYSSSSPLCIFDSRNGNLLHKVGERPERFNHKTVLGSHQILREGTLINIKDGEIAGCVPQLLEGKQFVVVALTSDTKHVLLVVKDSTVMLNCKSFDVLLRIPHKHTPSQLVVSEDCSLALIGYSIDCIVKVYNIDRSNPKTFGQQLLHFNYHSALPGDHMYSGHRYHQEVFDLQLSHDSSRFLVSIKHLLLFVVDIKSGSAVRMITDSFSGQDLFVHRSSFNHNSSVVVAIYGNNLCIWNSFSGKLLSHVRLNASDEDHFKLALAPTANFAATSSSHETCIKIWDLSKFEEATVPSVFAYNNPVDVVAIANLVKLAFIKTYKRLNSRLGYQYSDYFGIDVWNLATNHRQNFLPFGRFGQLIAMQVSLDGKRLVLVLDNNSTTIIAVLNVFEGKLVGFMHQPGCFRVQLSPNSQYLMTEATQVKLWNLVNCQLVTIFEDSQNCSFSTDSKYAIMVQKKKRITSFELKTKKMSSTPLRKMQAIGLDTIPNKNEVALVTGMSSTSSLRRVNKVEVYNFLTGERIWRMEHIAPAGILDVSKNGCYAVDGYLQVINLNDGKVMVEKHWGGSPSQERMFVRLTDDGHYVIWADQRPTDCIKVMRVHDGRLVAEVGTHSKVVSLNLADYGYMVLAGCQDGHFLSFNLHNVSIIEVEDEDDDMFDSQSQISALDNSCHSTSSTDSIERILEEENDVMMKNYVRREFGMAINGKRKGSLGHILRDANGYHSSIETLDEMDPNDNNVRVKFKIAPDSRSRSGSRLNLVEQRTVLEQCHISREDLTKLDDLYQSEIEVLTNDELPTASKKVAKDLESKAHFSFTNSPENVLSRRRSHSRYCTIL